MEGHQRLGHAVIIRAFLDAISKRDTKQRQDARSFLLAKSLGWAESREYWCFMGGIKEELLDKKMKDYEKNGWPSAKKYSTKTTLYDILF